MQNYYIVATASVLIVLIIAVTSCVRDSNAVELKLADTCIKQGGIWMPGDFEIGTCVYSKENR